ncbi:MAG: phosphotransferase family protein [Candidatus Binataceae bacterium]
MLDPDNIRVRLAKYLGADIAALRVLASGWETTVFEFALASPSHLRRDIPVERPLVLRFYQGSLAAEKGPREWCAFETLASLGYCVPRPYAFEADAGIIGAPFLVMERVAGGPLFSTRSFPSAVKTFSLGFLAFVRAQARLHRFDPRATALDQIPRAFAAEQFAPDAPLLDRVLALIKQRVAAGPLPGLTDALHRLTARAPLFRTRAPAFVHLDFHPQNVIVSGLRVTGVIDWVNADLGDRHLDAAMTAVILSSSAMEHPRWMRDNFVGNSLRTTFTTLYVPLYHAFYPLDFERFRYFQGVAALLRLSMLGMMRARGAEIVGFRPEAIGEVTPGVLRLLSRYAARKSGAAIPLEFGSPVPA